MTTPAKTTPATAEAPDTTVLFETITRADSGDATALEQLREVLREVPDVVRHVSDLAANAEIAILGNVPPGAQALFRRQTSILRRELAEEGTGTALERMLIRRIGLDYVASLQADRVRALAPGERRSLELSRFYDQQADRAHRRFLASVETLARVRKLIAPIQINIAEQQVNVAGTVRTNSGTGDAT
jgi:hypothetical protein